MLEFVSKPQQLQKARKELLRSKLQGRVPVCILSLLVVRGADCFNAFRHSLHPSDDAVVWLMGILHRALFSAGALHVDDISDTRDVKNSACLARARDGDKPESVRMISEFF